MAKVCHYRGTKSQSRWLRAGSAFFFLFASIVSFYLSEKTALVTSTPQSSRHQQQQQRLRIICNRCWLVMLFQDEKNQIITTNCWLNQVSDHTVSGTSPSGACVCSGCRSMKRSLMTSENVGRYSVTLDISLRPTSGCDVIEWCNKRLLLLLTNKKRFIRFQNISPFYLLQNSIKWAQ